MKIIKIKIDDIVVPKRKRGLDDEKVLQLAASIEELGLINHITLRSGNILMAGLHRLKACDTLGWEEIDAVMFEELSDLEAEKIEIDENFQRFELTKLQESQQALRRREIWEEEHGPITRRPRSSMETLVEVNNVSFNEMICRLLGKSRVSADRIISIARDLDREVQETIEGLPICDNRAELKRLAKLPVDEQKKVAEGLKSGTITKVPVEKPPIVDEDASPEPPEDPKPPRAPRTPRKPTESKDNDPTDWNRKVKEAVREIKTTIKQQVDLLKKYEGYLPESTESVVLHFNKQIADQLNSLRI